MYLTNTFGRCVLIEDEQLADKLINFSKMRESTPDEIEAYHRKNAERAAMTSNSDKSFYFSTVPSSPDGYGMSRDFIKSELINLGIIPSETYTGQKVGLLYSYPYGVIRMQSDIKLIYTMFESDKIPVDWPEYFKEADEVLVPTKWCQEVFAKSGVQTTVVPLGYNDRAFRYIDRPVPIEERKDFTFIHFNSFNLRKGFSEVLKAFVAEFKNDEPVRLILKTTAENTPLPLTKSEYPKIEVIRGAVKEKDLIEILARANCMVYPSRGEGFGLTPLEAMATGLPAIVPNAHGITEYFDSKYMLEVAVEEKCPGLYQRFKNQDVGQMVVCSVDDLRKKMRYAYNHQTEMKEFGKKASEYVTRWTYRKTALQLKEIIEKWQKAPVIKKHKDSRFLAVERV